MLKGGKRGYVSLLQDLGKNLIPMHPQEGQKYTYNKKSWNIKQSWVILEISSYDENYNFLKIHPALKFFKQKKKNFAFLGEVVIPIPLC